MPNDKDYDADGSLIVDPQKMMKDGYSDIGKLLGFCMARFVEKKWVKFQPVLNRQTLAAGIAGAILLLFLKKTVKQPCVALCGDNAAMIGSQAYYEYSKDNITADLTLNAVASMPLI